MHHYQGLIGLIILLLLAWSFSEQQKALNWRTVIVGIALQFILAAILVKLPASRKVFILLNGTIIALEKPTTAGTSLL